MISEHLDEFLPISWPLPIIDCIAGGELGNGLPIWSDDTVVCREMVGRVDTELVDGIEVRFCRLLIPSGEYGFGLLEGIGGRGRERKNGFEGRLIQLVVVIIERMWNIIARAEFVTDTAG